LSVSHGIKNVLLI